MREKLLATQESSAIDPFTVNVGAFHQLIDDLEFGSVGGLCFLVVRSRAGYIYERGIHVTGSQPIPPGGVAKVESGGPEIGGYSYSFVVPVEAGIACAGVYFPPGKAGILYCPLKNDDPVRIANISWNPFLDRAQTYCGIAFHGLYVE